VVIADDNIQRPGFVDQDGKALVRFQRGHGLAQFFHQLAPFRRGNTGLNDEVHNSISQVTQFGDRAQRILGNDVRSRFIFGHGQVTRHADFRNLLRDGTGIKDGSAALGTNRLVLDNADDRMGGTNVKIGVRRDLAGGQDFAAVADQDFLHGP